MRTKSSLPTCIHRPGHFGGWEVSQAQITTSARKPSPIKVVVIEGQAITPIRAELKDCGVTDSVIFSSTGTSPHILVGLQGTYRLSFTLTLLAIDHDRARRRRDVLLFIGTHARECRFGDAQFQEEISFECQSLCQRCLGSAADEALDASNRFRRM
jgi:hypothetical protein